MPGDWQGALVQSLHDKARGMCKVQLCLCKLVIDVLKIKVITDVTYVSFIYKLRKLRYVHNLRTEHLGLKQT